MIDTRAYSELSKIYPQVFGNVFPTTENFKIKFHTFIVCSYLRKSAKFYTIISKLDNVMPFLAKSSSEF